jgi:hypothetical protein
MWGGDRERENERERERERDDTLEMLNIVPGHDNHSVVIPPLLFSKNFIVLYDSF